LPGFDDLSDRVRSAPDDVTQLVATLRELDGIADGEARMARIRELASQLVGDEHARHYIGDWLRAWWGDSEAAEPALRRGYVEALSRALERNHAVDGIWVAGAAERVEVVVLENRQQVTMLVLTPAVPD
jgi:hypothetical protein